MASFSPEPSTGHTASELCIQEIVKLHDALLEALIETFPDHSSTLADKLLAFRMACVHNLDTVSRDERCEQLAKATASSLGRVAAELKARDAAFIDGIQDLLGGIDLHAMWTVASVENRETVCQYLDNLLAHGQMYEMYNKVPTRMMENINRLGNTLQGGNPADMNIGNLANQMLAGVDQAEMESFAKGMLGDANGPLAGLLGSLQAGAPSTPGKLGSLN
jgi:hypothetical protein